MNSFKSFRFASIYLPGFSENKVGLLYGFGLPDFFLNKRPGVSYYEKFDTYLHGTSGPNFKINYVFSVVSYFCI